MFCTNCDNAKPLKAKSVTRKFSESGLDNVTLVGVEEYTCKKCGEVYHGYGNIQQLHDLIAGLLIRKNSPLTNAEIRYLRKYMGYSSAIFAEKIIGMKRESYCRIETGKSAITAMMDRFIRVLVSEKMTDRNYNLHDHFLNETGESFKRIAFKYTQQQVWKYELSG